MNKDYKCVYCETSFYEAGSLKKHIHSNHEAQKLENIEDKSNINTTFDCNLCKKRMI